MRSQKNDYDLGTRRGHFWGCQSCSVSWSHHLSYRYPHLMKIHEIETCLWVFPCICFNSIKTWDNTENYLSSSIMSRIHLFMFMATKLCSLQYSQREQNNLLLDFKATCCFSTSLCSMWKGLVAIAINCISQFLGGRSKLNMGVGGGVEVCNKAPNFKMAKSTVSRPSSFACSLKPCEESQNLPAPQFFHL